MREERDEEEQGRREVARERGGEGNIRDRGGRREVRRGVGVGGERWGGREVKGENGGGGGGGGKKGRRRRRWRTKVRCEK